MIKAYKSVKQQYFENNKETTYLELEGLEKSLDSAKQEVAHLSTLLEEAQGRIKALERENTRISSELAEASANRQELIGLREFLFSLDQQEAYVKPEFDESSLKSFHAVMIGGHERWQAKMKELLPEVVFIHPDNLNFDLRILENTDTILIYPNYLSHAMYYRVMSAVAGRGNVRIDYINQQNEEKVLREISRLIKEE